MQAYTSIRRSDGKPRLLRKVTNLRAAWRQARRIMEMILGFKLPRWLLVHHRDENPFNNDPKNLEITTHRGHYALHKSLASS